MDTTKKHMKTITIKFEAYDINELKELHPEGYKKAYSNFKDGNEYFFLEDNMNERLKELLEENNIKYRKYPQNVGLPEVMYSLSHCQGDGACFTGVFQYKNITAYITHKGNYCHSYSTTIECQETNNLGFHTDESEEIYKEEAEFHTIYQKICEELEEFGYSFIEYEDSEERFIENCEANEYYFSEDGEIVQ